MIDKPRLRARRRLRRKKLTVHKTAPCPQCQAPVACIGNMWTGRNIFNSDGVMVKRIPRQSWRMYRCARCQSTFHVEAVWGSR